jgi:hypothetical protein
MDQKIGDLHSALITLAFHKEKPVPKRDAGHFYFSGLPHLVGLTLPVRGEVMRASSKIETSAPLADSGQAIWVGRV